jgi:hypothetical protein
MKKEKEKEKKKKASFIEDHQIAPVPPLKRHRPMSGGKMRPG